MATGICYTWSGNVKKYEGINASDIPNKVTVYTVGYPSTTYYPDGGLVAFSLIQYPPPPGYPEVEGFVEGTAHYITDMYLDNSGTINDTVNTIRNLMSYTPPDEYILDKNGSYTYTATATVYSYNYNIKYFSKTNTVNGGTVTISREFKYKKKDKLDTYIKYYVTLSLSNGMLNCKCNSVTNIPGTNNGNVTLGINIELGDGKGDGVSGGRTEFIQFSWVMKNGINESKSCSVPYYAGSGFTTQSSWEIDNGDGSKTYYTFYINHDSIPSRPNSKSL